MSKYFFQINGMPLDLKKMYTCAVNGFIASGEEGYKVLSKDIWKVIIKFAEL